MTEKVIVQSVSDNDDWFSISTTNATGFGLEKKYGVCPVVGDEITLYFVNGFGTPIRGMDLNGNKIFYKSDEQLFQECQEWLDKYNQEKQDAFNKNKKQLDLDYKSLPNNFKKRINRFRKNNPDFRIEYESYEMFCCKEALKIANACKTPENVMKFHDATLDNQNIMVSNLDNGHSGNTFGCACHLAYLHLTRPDDVWKQHGALSPLVGSNEYGDIKK